MWNEDEEEETDIEWDDEPYEDEDQELAEELAAENPVLAGMEPDDGMSWEDGAAEVMQAQAQNSTSDRASADQDRQSSERSVVTPTQANGTPLRLKTSRERVLEIEDPSRVSPSSPSGRQLDPAQATETRKLTVTPTIARDDDTQVRPKAGIAPVAASGPMLPSAILQQQSEERKRTREEIEALEQAARKKLNMGPPVAKDQSPSVSSTDSRVTVGPSKLRKEREPDEDPTKDKKKKGGMLAGLFGRRKEKSKEKGSSSGFDSEGDRPSQDSSFARATSIGSAGSSTIPDGMMSPTSEIARQQQANLRASAPQQVTPGSQQPPQNRPQGAGPQTPPQGSPLSQHATTLRQRDQQQQALYQQYLNRSPSSPPEVQPSYGLQSASAMGHATSFSSTSSVASSLATPTRPRPGSLVLSPSAMDGPGVPELSVIRVFAGKNVQTEATFKTVLLNSSTTSEELVRQAMQRFRLPGDEHESDYYLTVKQMEGSSATLRPGEKPLGVFESLVEAAMELPKVKRSSVGSISSLASNLSMHPAIKKLSMNDFSDDSAVKFYLNRRYEDDPDTSGELDEGNDTIVADVSQDDAEEGTTKSPFLSVTPPTGQVVTADRFSSPSVKFALQLVIYPEDLPDDMVFDPVTEAIVFKDTLRERNSIPSTPTVSPAYRKKVFMFPKNVTVAEVIELGLERFGILEGVVDGGDEVEDKMGKRRSASRVRYVLHVETSGQSELFSA